MSRVLMDFYDRMLDSEIAGDYFDGVDMDRLIDHQTKFISYLMGGPASYTDEQLRRSHAHLNIDDAAFDEMQAILCATLNDHGFESSDVETVRREVEQRRHIIVTS